MGLHAADQLDGRLLKGLRQCGQAVPIGALQRLFGAAVRHELGGISAAPRAMAGKGDGNLCPTSGGQHGERKSSNAMFHGDSTNFTSAARSTCVEFQHLVFGLLFFATVPQHHLQHAIRSPIIQQSLMAVHVFEQTSAPQRRRLLLAAAGQEVGALIGQIGAHVVQQQTV